VSACILRNVKVSLAELFSDIVCFVLCFVWNAFFFICFFLICSFRLIRFHFYIRAIAAGTFPLSLSSYFDVLVVVVVPTT
jgi:hypothetical protein